MVGVVFGKTLVRFANPNLGYDFDIFGFEFNVLRSEMEDAIKFAKKETVVFTDASVNQVGTEIDGASVNILLNLNLKPFRISNRP